MSIVLLWYVPKSNAAWKNSPDHTGSRQQLQRSSKYAMPGTISLCDTTMHLLHLAEQVFFAHKRDHAMPALLFARNGNCVVSQTHQRRQL
jgi:hypothetical protein